MAAGLILATGKDTDPTHDDLYSFHRPKNRTGLAVAAAAAVVGLTDALITAHHVRARAAVRAPDRGRTRTGLLPPSVDADGRSAHIALVRLSF